LLPSFPTLFGTFFPLLLEASWQQKNAHKKKKKRRRRRYLFK
jgi:hypothetical protein